MGSNEGKVKLVMTKKGPLRMTCSLALMEKGIEFEDVEPKDLVVETVYKDSPVLVHNGRGISHMPVILEYIEDAWPPSDTTGTPSLLPVSPYQRSLVRFWVDFAYRKILNTGFQKLLREEQYTTARQQIVEEFITIDKEMKAIGSEEPFFLGTKLSMADVALAPLVAWLSSFEVIGGLTFPGPEQCSRIDKWLAAMRDHPNVAASVPTAEQILEFKRRH